MLDGLTGVYAHSDYSKDDAALQQRYNRGEPMTAAELAELRASLAPNQHPLVRYIPETGRKSLWLSPRHTRSIKELFPDESEALLQYLFEVQIRPDYVVRYQWSAGDVVIWDHRTTLHSGVDDYGPARRQGPQGQHRLVDPAPRPGEPHHLLPLVRVPGGRAAVVGDAGHVDQTVEPVEALGRLSTAAATCASSRDVGEHGTAPIESATARSSRSRLASTAARAPAPTRQRAVAAPMPLEPPLARKRRPVRSGTRVRRRRILGLLAVTRAAVPHLTRNDRGDVVTIGSISGIRRASVRGTVHSGTKFAVHAIADGMREELAPQGIRVSVIAPSYFRTEIFDHLPDPAARERMQARLQEHGMDPEAWPGRCCTSSVSRPRSTSSW